MSIYDALQKAGYSPIKHKGRFGLEIETEIDLSNAYNVPTFAFWDVHADGSLRGYGREYVLKQPLDFITIPEALEEFRTKLEKVKFIQDSITTSVHVHTNILHEDFSTFGNFLTTYALVENLLIRFSGEERVSNMFCLPICDAEETYKNIISMLKQLAPNKSYSSLAFDRDSTKYAALNLSSIVRFGSLEIRSFRGTTDTKAIETWVGIINNIFEYSKQKMLPPDIIKAYKDKGTELLTDIFAEHRKVLKVKDEEALVEKNFWYAANIGLTLNEKQWKNLDAVSKPKKSKSSDLDELSMKHYGKLYEALSHQQQVAIINYRSVDTGEEVVQHTDFDDDTGDREIGDFIIRDDADAPQPRAGDTTRMWTTATADQLRVAADQLRNPIPMRNNPARGDR